MRASTRRAAVDRRQRANMIPALGSSPCSRPQTSHRTGRGPLVIYIQNTTRPRRCRRIPRRCRRPRSGTLLRNRRAGPVRRTTAVRVKSYENDVLSNGTKKRHQKTKLISNSRRRLFFPLAWRSLRPGQPSTGSRLQGVKKWSRGTLLLARRRIFFPLRWDHLSVECSPISNTEPTSLAWPQKQAFPPARLVVD